MEDDELRDCEECDQAIIVNEGMLIVCKKFNYTVGCDAAYYCEFYNEA